MKLSSLLLILVVSVLGLSACSADSDPASRRPQLAYVTNCVASFWTFAEAGVRAAEKDFDVDCDVRMPASTDAAKQQQILEDVLARGVDGIAVSPVDPENQIELLNQIGETTRLITHDSDAPGTNRLCYIGTDNYDAGLLCGKLVREALPGGGSIMMFVGNLGQDNARRRRQGVIDAVLGRTPDPERYDEPGVVLEADGYTVLDTRTDMTDPAKAKSNAEDAIALHPDLGCMVGLFADNTPACMEALSAAGKLGVIKLVGFDEHESTLQGIVDGHVHGTVVQNPYRYGYESVRILAGLARGDQSVLPADGILFIPGRSIRRDNVEEFWLGLKKLMK